MDFSLVSETISNNSESEIKYLNDSIKNVTDKIHFLKLNAKERMTEKYVNFIPIVEGNEKLLQDASDLIEDVKQLQSRLDNQTKRDVNDLTEELQTLQETLIESSTIVDVIEKLCKIEEDFKKAREKAKIKEYFLTARHINEISTYLNDNHKDIGFLDIFKKLTESVTFYKDKYSRETISQWREYIVWNQINGDLKNKRTHVSLSISVEKTKLENLLKTLEMFKVADREVAAFGDNLLKLVLLPVIKTESSVNVKKTSLSEELSVSCFSDIKNPPYKQVLENLTIIFQFIDDKLGINMLDTSFITYLGNYIADDFLNKLIDECLSDVIPLKREHLKNYAPIIEPITNFQSLLISIGFIPKSNKVLENYFGDVETLFLTKRIENYISTARDLMMRDLHEIIEVGDSTTNETTTMDIKIKSELGATGKSIYSDTLPMDVDKLCPNLFKFPKCSISSSVEELVRLVSGILNESNESDSKTCLKLFHTARQIIDIYPNIVSMYHTKLLHDIPQCSAILYNNLMYLSHHVLTIDYDKKAQDNASDGNRPPIACFADLIVPLRGEAVKVLSRQIECQQKILLKFIKESGLSQLSELEELPESTEKSIRACLKQLSFLKAVWQKVLPVNIYSQVIGGLCTVIIDDITSRVVATSDIRADIATSLVQVLSNIQIEAPRLFAEPNEVYLHVKSWSKLKELILVLGASLAEVGERWADGKGPLAVEFTAEQVRQMVRALFQVSDRRAAVLSRIK